MVKYANCKMFYLRISDLNDKMSLFKACITISENYNPVVIWGCRLFPVIPYPVCNPGSNWAVLSRHTEGSKAFTRYREIDDDIKRELVDMLEWQ